MLTPSQLACNLPSPDIAQRSLGYCLGSLTGIDVQHVDALRTPTLKTQAGGVLSLRFSSFYLSCTEPSYPSGVSRTLSTGGYFLSASSRSSIPRPGPSGMTRKPWLSRR